MVAGARTRLPGGNTDAAAVFVLGTFAVIVVVLVFHR
jgi:hypothetical protein